MKRRHLMARLRLESSHPASFSWSFPIKCELRAKEALTKWIPFMPFDGAQDRTVEGLNQSVLKGRCGLSPEPGPWVSPDHHRPGQPVATKTAITAFSADHGTARTMRATSTALHEKC
jgi:hypothetical protein